MTTLQHYQEFARIDSALRFVARRWWWVRLAQRSLSWLAGSLLLLIAMAGVSGFVNLSAGVRLAMLIALLAAPAAGLVLWVILPLCRRLTPRQAARQIEQRLGGQENRFINAVQLAENGDLLFDPELVRRTIDEIAKTTSGVPVDRAVTTERLMWSAGAAALVGAALVLFLVMAGGKFSYGLHRLIAHDSRGWQGQIRIDQVVPRDVPGPVIKSALLSGAKLTIEARVSAPADFPASPAGRLWIRKQGDTEFTAFEMNAVRPIGQGRVEGAYSRELVVDRSFEYYVSIGDTDQCDNPYKVQVLQLPLVAEFKVQPIYPAYLRGEQPAKPQDDGNIDAPLGSKAELSVRMNRPVVAAEAAILASQSPVPMIDRGDRLNWSATLPLLRTMQYRLVFRDQSNDPVGELPSPVRAEAAAAPDKQSSDETAPAAQPAQAAFFNVTTRPDYAPAVQILRPGPNAMVKPGGTLDVVIQASDDHGLTGLRLMVAHVKYPTTVPDQAGGVPGLPVTDIGPVEVRNSWTSKELSGAEDGPAHYRATKLVKKTATLKVGDVEGDRLVLWAEATDNRDLTDQAVALGLTDGGGPQMTRSTRFIVTVQDPEKIAALQKQALDRLMAEITALLREQTDVRTATAGLTPRPGHPGPADLAKAAAALAPAAATAAVAKGQSEFLNHLLRLAKGLIVKFSPETEPIQARLMVLAYNDAATAKALADALGAVADAKSAAADQPTRKLLACQDRVIQTLQALLGLIGQAEKRTDQASSRPDNTDLSADAREKWKKLANDLGEFIKQQSKDIATLQSLAKKPVDDFAKDQILKDLAANEDKWEKMLEEKISDFSKLAEQDFSNPSLLKELISVKDDVVMAKDALQKKATEMAIPLEENGLELAESLTTHIEKWLSDTPNREQWKMEEPIDQKDAPMVELPKELEDLIGDLMEQEEDLFEQIEDATSKWTDSIDKGAGWDAADGPISNNSAQGVTGNRLPSNDEIAGRSGEGRTGKANGEMVGNEASGKGGRNTPTRLTPDAFQKGQVKDTSKDPPGGATGGGKVSGVAGEGLEGPVPPDVQKNLQRLASKQAAIRNKAESVDARFKANNFNNFALQKTLTVMRLTEQDLQNNRYQNALRKVTVVVNNLQAQKMMLGGKIIVQSDKSPELPPVPRKDIRNIDEDDLPPRYKELAKEYLKSLGEETPPADVP